MISIVWDFGLIVDNPEMNFELYRVDCCDDYVYSFELIFDDSEIKLKLCRVDDL